MHAHRFWIDFENNKVCCNGINCKEKMDVEVALRSLDKNFALEVTQSKLNGHEGKVYLVRYAGEYLCTITGCSGGVLFLHDFKGDSNLFELFKRAVSNFGVSFIQIKKERKDASKF